MFWSVDIIWKATLLLGLAFAADAALRRASAAVRDVVWTLAFASVLVLPFVSSLAPEWSAPLAASFTASTASVPGPPREAVNWFYWIWCAGAAVAGLRLVAAHVRAGLLVRRAHRLDERVRESAPGTMPLTWGLLRPVVVIPADAASWPDAVRRSVLRHEMAHIERGDLAKQLLGQIVCCLFWFHPLVWLAAARAAQVRELACDDTVLTRGAEPMDYARHLLDVARRVRPLASAAAMTYCSRLEGRIMGLLDTNRRRASAKRGFVVTSAVLAVAVLVSVAGARLYAEQVYKVSEDGIAPPKLLHKVEPEYTEFAKDAGIEGTVVLKLEITSDGEPDKIEVTEGLDVGLDANAIAAVRQWRFRPGEKDGKPVRTAATIEVNFRLE